MSLYVRDYSSSSAAGIPVVILHGLFGSGDNWQTIAREIGATRYCWSIDLPGHGDSPWGSELRYQAMARAVSDTIIGKTGDRKAEVALIGHSMGGKTAMAVALQDPGLVNRLVVVDIAPKRYAPHHEDIFLAFDALDTGHLTQRSQADGIMGVHVTDAMVRGFLLKNLRPLESGGYAWRFDVDGIRRDYDHILDWPLGLDELSPFRKPTCFIVGAESDFLDAPTDWEHIERLFPNAELRTVSQARHWVHADNRTGFMEQLLRFLV